MTFNTVTCGISGTATSLAAQPVTYYATASNPGNDPVTASIRVAVVAPAPKTISYSPSNFVYTVGHNYSGTFPTPITTGGTPTSYDVSPALPDGLLLNNATGIISGNASKVTSDAETFQITGSNSGGHVSTSIQITINAVAPTGITYAGYGSQPQLNLLKDHTVYAHAIIPAADTAGGAQVVFDVSPSLPEGMHLDTSRGDIYGTPTTIIYPAYVYTIMAQSTGTSPVPIPVTITVLDVAPTQLAYPTSGSYPKYSSGTFTYTWRQKTDSALIPTHDGERHQGSFSKHDV